MDTNLIIDDDYIQDVGTLCRQRGEKLEEILTSYLDILQEIRDEAVMDGAICASLEAYKECASMISGQLETISEQIQNVCKAFINEINEADSYLF